jgi:hypothetical protein
MDSNFHNVLSCFFVYLLYQLPMTWAVQGPTQITCTYPVLTQEHVLQGSKSKKTGHVCNLQKSVILIAIVVSNKIMFFS